MNTEQPKHPDKKGNWQIKDNPISTRNPEEAPLITHGFFKNKLQKVKHWWHKRKDAKGKNIVYTYKIAGFGFQKKLKK